MFKKLTSGCMPKRGTMYSACVDLFAAQEVRISAGETELVGTGICIDLNALKENHYTVDNDGDGMMKDVFVEWDEFLSANYLQLMIRSSLAKKGLMLSNGVGIIDLDYVDEIKMIIHKPATFFDMMLKVFTLGIIDIPHTIKKGEKIGQITLLEHKSHLFGIESRKKRVGGFGSTGL